MPKQGKIQAVDRKLGKYCWINLRYWFPVQRLILRNWRALGLTKSDLDTFIYIRDRQDEIRRDAVSLRYIAQYAPLSYHTLLNCVAHMEALKLLQVERRRGAAHSYNFSGLYDACWEFLTDDEKDAAQVMLKQLEQPEPEEAEDQPPYDLPDAPPERMNVIQPEPDEWQRTMYATATAAEPAPEEEEPAEAQPTPISAAMSQQEFIWYEVKRELQGKLSEGAYGLLADLRVDKYYDGMFWLECPAGLQKRVEPLLREINAAFQKIMPGGGEVFLYEKKPHRRAGMLAGLATAAIQSIPF